MSKKKYLLSIFFFLIIVVITFYTIFSIDNPITIINCIKEIKITNIIIILLFILLYFVFQGIYMKLILKSLNSNISLTDGIIYSVIEFLFSGITPSSTGGQPVQLYYMKKDKIPVRKSLITLILNTIYFKLILFLFGIVIIIFYKNIIYSNIYLTIFFYLGFITDLIIVVLGFLILFKQKIIKKFLNIYYKLKLKIKHEDGIDINKIVKEKINIYNAEIKYIKSHKLEVYLGFIITLVQRVVLFSISYLIYKALGLSEYNYFYLLICQVIVQISIEAVLLPGGSGVSEFLLSLIFSSVFGASLANPSMLLTRIFTFYFPLILSLMLFILRCIKKRHIYFKK
ncbi:MAG: lysylphosphatidylglycerol synthase transmembrane domain-containing protein [bacterium]|nr:lysylphosphatidylglycerol synthase transmembrane domain-containing protein [bacterium]